MNRVAIVGPVASGKTALATRLAPILALPALDLDDYYWRQATIPTEDEWQAKHSELIGRDRWIISGDYRAVAIDRFSAADAVVWLDLPRGTCIYRATRRKMRGYPAPLIDCWRWIWRYARHGRRETEMALANPRLTCAIYRLRSPKDVDSFLSQVQG